MRKMSRKVLAFLMMFCMMFIMSQNTITGYATEVDTTVTDEAAAN